MLIAEPDPVNARLSAVERLQAVTRLASFTTTHAGEPLLAEDSIGKTWATVGHFARRAPSRGAALLGVVATEAVRASSKGCRGKAHDRGLGCSLILSVP